MKTKLVKSITSCLLFAYGLASLVAVGMAAGISDVATADNGVTAQPGQCNQHTLRGSYIFATHGWNVVGGIAVPKAIVEGIDFNGDGTLVSPFATVSVNGTILHSSGSVGTYTVAANCTGTLTFTGGASFDIFVQPGDGKQLWMIQTGPAVAPPAVFEGTATKVSP